MMRKYSAIFVVSALTLACVAGVLLWLRQNTTSREQAWQSIHSQEAVDETQKLGNAMIDAIIRYASDRGRFPDALLDLVPDYLDSVHPPLAGEPVWRYERSASGYRLAFGFGEAVYPGYMYDSQQPQLGWQLDM